MSKFSEYRLEIVQWSKENKISAGIIAVVLVIAIYNFATGGSNSSGAVKYVTEAAAKTTITVAVSGSGQVSQENRIDLKPSGSGTSTQTLTAVSVKQGDNVKAGQVIAIVDQKNNLISLNSTKAALASAQANYDKVLAGATSQDLQVSQAAVDSAQASLDNAKSAYDNTVLQQKITVSNALASLLNASLAAQAAATNSSTATATVSGQYNGTEQGQYVVTVTLTGVGYEYNVSGLETGQSGQLNRGQALPLGTHGLFITFSASGSLAMNDSWIIPLPNTQATNYFSLNNTYQSALAAQIQALNSAQSSIKSAQAGLEQALAQQSLKQAPATQADVAVAAAQVQSAQAQYDNALIAYDNNIIKAPFDGVVAQLNNQTGDQVSSSTVIATLITKQKLAILPLNEVDVAKVRIGQKASLTFDAIDGLEITGEVAQIDTIGTVSQGVVTYNVKIGFDTQDDRIKTGMSVSANIITDIKPDVLAVPNAALKSDANGSYVQVLDSSGQVQNKAVVTGVANDTSTEIISGLNEGDAVVTQTINSSAAKTTTGAAAGAGLRIPGITTGGAAGRAGAGGGFNATGR